MNMKIREVQLGTEYCTGSETVMVYKVWEHKTKVSYGSANLVIPQKFHTLMTRYMTHHRPQPSEGCEEYVFLTPNGRRVTHLSDELARLSRDFPTQHGVLKVSSTEMRKMSSTAVASTKDDAMIRSVANHLTHDPSTAKAYYQHVHGSKNSLQAYNTLNSVPKVVENPAPT